MAEIAGARVLVTGATGFIGSHLVRRLVNDRADVHALTSTVSSVYPTRLLDLRDRITLHEGNLIDRSALDAITHEVRPRYVFHLGAYTHVGKSWQRVDECVQVNVQGTVNLLQALAGNDYERFVNVGTSEIYGDVPVPFKEDGPVNPISPYSASPAVDQSKFTIQRSLCAIVPGLFLQHFRGQTSESLCPLMHKKETNHRSAKQVAPCHLAGAHTRHRR